MKGRKRLGLLLAGIVALTGCDREDPTGIGGALIPDESVRTFEVILDANEFLVMDTAFSAFPPAQSNFVTIANSFDGALNANALARFRVTPIIGVPDSAGVIQIDSLPKLVRGRLYLKLDTVASARTGPVLLHLYRTGEAWDSTAVSWQNRTAGTPWATPGGTRGTLLDTVTLTTGDSVVFDVDTATLALWRDSTTQSPGVLITAESPNVRLRAATPTLAVDMRTSIGDTIVTVPVPPFVTRVLFDPPVPAVSGDPRVGGVPSWRTILQLDPDFEDIEVPCPFSPTCRVRLRDASIARAELLLQPAVSPPGFAPELPLTVLVYSLLPTPELPLVRSPLATGQGFATISNGNFRTPGAPVAPIQITSYIRSIVTPADTTAFRTRYLTLLQGGTTTFGYGTFAAGPQLRLRLSVSQEIQLP
jgi:hypothetical protein